MDELLLTEVRELAATIEHEDEAKLLVALFDIASQAEFVPPAQDDYTPFVYPH